MNTVEAQQVKTWLYTTNDGLPGSYSYSIYEDSFGYLWINTTNGLSRYDGKQFVNFNASGGNTSVMLEDSRHQLWVITNTGLGRMEEKKIITYPLNDTFRIQYFFKIIETRDKHIWALTEKGVYQFEDKLWKKISLYPGFENFHCRHLIETDTGLYINYGDYIVFRNLENKWRVIADRQFYNTSFFNGMIEDKGKIFVSTKSAIYKLEKNQLEPVIENLKGNSYFHFFFDSKNRLWYVFQEGDSSFHVSSPGNFQKPGYLIPNRYGQIGVINEDSHGNIWIGTEEGLLKITDAPWYTIHESQNKILGKATSAIFLSDSSLFLSSHEGFYNYFPLSDKTKSKLTALKKEPGPVDCFIKDDKEGVWLITRSGKMFFYNNKQLKDVSRLIKMYEPGSFGSGAFDKQKNRMFFCSNSTLLFGNEREIKYFIPPNTMRPVNGCISVLSGRKGEMLVLISGEGIFRIDKNDNLKLLWKNTNKNVFGNLYNDNAGNIWLPEEGVGLRQFRFENNMLQAVKVYSEENGLQNNTIYSVASDFLQRLWVVTATGLDVLQENRDKNWEVYNYSKDAGLTLSNSFLTKIFTDLKGDIWLTSWHEMIKFETRQIHLKKENPKVIIEKVLVNSKEVDWKRYTDSLFSYNQFPVSPKLEYANNTITINFNGISFSSHPRLEYSYQLSPLDTSWSLPSSNPSVSFVRLSPGHYEFKVKTRNRASGWSEPAVFRFTIAAPFWMTWWFIGFIILAISFLLFSIYKYRINQIKKLLAIRTKISQDLHDEVGSTLTSINILSTISKSNLEKDKSKAARLLQKIAEQSTDMQQSMSDIVWSIRPDSDKIKNLVIRMREYLAHTAEPKNIMVEFFADEKVLNRNLSMKQRQHVFLIYKEAVNNAVKYSQGKKISVFLGKENNHIRLSIQDDGLGFDPGKITSSSGLKNMNDRAKELKGTLQILSLPKQGTEILLLCPAT